MSDQFFGIEQQQKQEQTLTPQQRQSLEVLAAPLMELQARLNQEAQLNPMLEVEGPALEYSVGDPLSNAIAAEDRAAAADMDPEDREMEELSAGMDGWLDALPLSDSDSGEAQDRSRRRDFALNSLTVSGNRQDYLLEQLRFADVPEKLFRAAVEVIGNLDERGFLLATDKEILQTFKADREKGLRMLFDQYYRQMVVYAHEQTGSLPVAEDIVQEFFIRLWEEDYLEKASEESLKSYLFVSIRNSCYTQLHSKAAQIQKVQLTDVDIPLVAAEEMNSKIVERVNEAIAQLPQQTAAVVDCILMQDMKYQETADRLGISINTVKTLLKKGMKQIREDLKDERELLLYIFFKKNGQCSHPF